MRAEIIGSGPGTAIIRVLGKGTPAPLEAFQIQRNQVPDSYLAPDGEWQASPDHWVSLGPADLLSKGEGFEFRIGPEIVDPIVTTLTRSTFRLNLRGGGKLAVLALAAAGQAPLLSSGARARPGVRPQEIPPVEPPAPPDIPIVEPPEIPIAPPSRIAPVAPQSRRGMLLAVMVALLVVGGGLAWWVYRDRAGTVSNGSPPESSSELSLRDELKRFMDTNPTAEALVSKADGMVAEGNREGALYLYRQAVDKGSMESALALGRLYDPTEPANSNSTIANAETASYWYAKAAAANIVEAQRRLGILQTRNGLNSSSFAMGIENLKKASDQGDADAAKKLKELGQ